MPVPAAQAVRPAGRVLAVRAVADAPAAVAVPVAVHDRCIERMK
jgi:hypothetical protein